MVENREKCQNPCIPPKKLGGVPKSPFCKKSGLSLEPDENGGFVCPPACEDLIEILRMSGMRIGNNKGTEQDNRPD